MRYLCLIALLWLNASFAQEAASADFQKYLSSETRSQVYAGQLVDAGELDKARQFIAQAIEKYPRSDYLQTLYGQTYYESKNIAEAERYFMQALRLNPLNKVAKAYVEVIRETEQASESQQLQELRSVMWDKIGDIAVFGLGVFFGSLMSGWAKRFIAWRFISSARTTFLKGDYDDFADMLEIQLTTNELKPLRESLAFMLEHKTVDESIALLNNYVNTEDHLKSLTRMLTLNETHHKS